MIAMPDTCGVDAEAFRQAMRRLAATVTIVATGKSPDRCGMTATAVCSLTVNPAQILTCLNAASSTCRAVRNNGRFSVNILDAEQKALAERFAGAGQLAGEGKFDDAEWLDDDTGVPILTRSVAVIGCEVKHAWPVDTHVILIGAVTRLWLQHEEPPLIYRDGRFGTWVARSS